MVHTIQTKELRHENNSSADRSTLQGGQILSGTDPIQFVSYKQDTYRPLSMPKFNISEMKGGLKRFEVLCWINNIRIDSEMFVALLSEMP